MENLNGTLSCLYDSVMQRELIEHGNDEEEYKKMLGIMRFDFLMMGTIVVMDAMWYDGTLFKTMYESTTGEEDFNDFTSFLEQGNSKNQPPLHVKCRENYAKVLSMGFDFSSIDDGELRQYMHDFIDTELDDKDLGGNLNKWEKYLQETKNPSDDLLDKFDQFKERLLGLDSLVEDPMIVKTFSLADMSEEGKSEMRSVFNEALEKFKRLDEYQKTAGNDDEIERLLESLQGNSPRRSDLISLANKLREKTNPWDVKDNISGVLHGFLKDYNRVLAFQHGVHFCEDDLRYAKLYVSDSLKEDGLLRKILDELKDMTWKDFGDLYYCEKLIKLRKDWIDAWGSQDKSTSDAACKLANYLNLLITKLPRSYQEVLDQSVFYEKEEHLLVVDGLLERRDQVFRVVVGQDEEDHEMSIEPERLVMFTADEDENTDGECSIKIDENTCHPSDLDRSSGSDRSSDSEFFKEFISHVRFGKSATK